METLCILFHSYFELVDILETKNILFHTYIKLTHIDCIDVGDNCSQDSKLSFGKMNRRYMAVFFVLRRRACGDIKRNLRP